MKQVQNIDHFTHKIRPKKVFSFSLYFMRMALDQKMIFDIMKKKLAINSSECNNFPVKIKLL